MGGSSSGGKERGLSHLEGKFCEIARGKGKG